MAEKYRKKPVVIEAMQWTKDTHKEVIAWLASGNAYNGLTPKPGGALHEYVMGVQTLEGGIFASDGDWIVRGVQGEFYPVKPDIFEATYEPANPEREGG